MFQHLRSFVQVRRSRPSGHETKPRKSSFRPCLESLEGRIVPTVFHPSSVCGGRRREQSACGHRGGQRRHGGYHHPGAGHLLLTLGELEISTPKLTINGTCPPPLSLSAISQEAMDRVFKIDYGANVTMTSLTIENGLAVNDGGTGIGVAAVAASST